MNILRRGSKKNLVQTIHIQSGINMNNVRVNDNSSNNLHRPDVTSRDITLKKIESELQKLTRENERLEKAILFSEDKAKYFEKLFNEKEADVLSLSATMNDLNLRNIELESENCDKVFDAKTKYIYKLEQELERVKEKSRIEAQRLQKKIKRLQESYAKSKQEYALKVFALKDEKKKLVEETNTLQEHLKAGMIHDPSKHENNELCRNTCDEQTETSFRARNELIIQLSQQVTALDTENKKLRQELEKTRMVLQKLYSEGQTCDIKRRSRSGENDQHISSLSLIAADISSSMSKVEIQG